MLGTILWGTYAEVFPLIEPHMQQHPTLCAGLAGGVAGGVQALLAAPAENMRILLEGGSGGSSWTKAWKEVFQGTRSRSISRKTDIEDIRQLRNWMKDVGGMAGRGWNGWGWGFGKDVFGFATFFSIFEVTRRVALQAEHISQQRVDQFGGARQHLPKMIHGLTLVSGGVLAGLAYETVCRPWDVTRRIFQLEKITAPQRSQFSMIRLIVQKARDDGILAFFRAHHSIRDNSPFQSGIRRRLSGILRALGRVGPWGVGFLVWEAYGPECLFVQERAVENSLNKAAQKVAYITLVFHEGLKSWSCCNDISKPVLDFDEFMKLPGCTEADRHTDETLKAEAPKPSSTTMTFTMSESGSGKETYSASLPAPASVSPPPPIVAPVEVEEDDLNVVIAPGTACRRNGCKVTFVSDAVNRQGDGEGTICTYHPAPSEEEITTCRVDHYQTVDEVHVSVYAKKADKERSVVEFEDTQVKFTIYLPGPKKFSRTLDLFGSIDPKQSTYKVLGTKVELHLRKRDGRSWTLLEKTAQDIGNISLTFGVGGRTGTIGAKELVLDDVNKAREAQ
ncbi:hypothetical protein C0995_001496 [Termitomyces sp. Mi166|nr:hypothetical protein C0995_001496 [Termitomyces sp. Mi166\